MPFVICQEKSIRTALPLDVRFLIIQKFIDTALDTISPEEQLEIICTLLGPHRTGCPTFLLDILFKKPQLFNYSAETLYLFAQAREGIGIYEELAEKLIEYKYKFFKKPFIPIHLLYPHEKMIPELHGSDKNYYFFDILHFICSERPDLLNYNPDNLIKIFPTIIAPEHSFFHQKLKFLLENSQHIKQNDAKSSA